MFIIKSLVALTLVGAVAVLSSGCVTNGTACNSPATPKVAQAPATPAPVQERVVTRDVPGPERIVYRDVPGPERIVTKEVIKEVPGPERIVIKEVEVQVKPTKESK